MGAFYETIPDSMIAWIRAQKMFFVATAPLSGDGHVNVSPKGGPYFGVIDNKTFWYLDLTGSGNETIAHLHEKGNGRVTIMFNAYEGPPKIARLWGVGEVLENGTSQFDNFVSEHKVKLLPGARSIIVVHIHQVGSSCGFSVPFYDFKEFRPVLNDFFAKKEAKFKAGKTEESMDRYWAYKNAWSIDGLAGMNRAQIAAKREKVAPIKKFVGPLAPPNGVEFKTRGSFVVTLLTALVFFLLGVFATQYRESVGRMLMEGVSVPSAPHLSRYLVSNSTWKFPMKQ